MLCCVKGIKVLQGFRNDPDFEAARRALGQFRQVTMLDLALQNARRTLALRKLGITVRKTIDGFIATYAITYGHELLHTDGDFDPFEAHLGLRVIHPKT